jgi:DNA-binding beta-propeller fold protein YncE
MKNLLKRIENCFFWLLVILSTIPVYSDNLSPLPSPTTTSSHSFLSQWGGSGPAKGQLWNPYGIALDEKNKVYVADYANDRIEVFDSTGKYLMDWGSKGNGLDQFHHALGVAIDQNGNLYAADTLNNRIKKYTSDGIYVSE